MTYVICGSHEQRCEMENLKDILEDLYCDTAEVILPEPCKSNEFLSEHHETWMEKNWRIAICNAFRKEEIS